MGKGLGASNTSLRIGATAIEAVAPGHLAATPSLARTRAEGHLLDNWLVFEVLGVLAGGFVGAYSSGRLEKETLKGPRISVPGRWGMAFLGGTLMGGAAHMARGCTSGWDLLAIGLEATVLVLFFVGLLTSGADGKAAARLLLGGRYTAEFWTLVVVAGLLLPLFLEALERRLHLKATTIYPLLVLLGGLSLAGSWWRPARPDGPAGGTGPPRRAPPSPAAARPGRAEPGLSDRGPAARA